MAVNPKRVVTKTFEGTYTDIKGYVGNYVEKFGKVFGTDHVDVSYGVFSYRSERYMTRDGEKVADVVFKVNVKFEMEV